MKAIIRKNCKPYVLLTPLAIEDAHLAIVSAQLATSIVDAVVVSLVIALSIKDEGNISIVSLLFY